MDWSLNFTMSNFKGFSLSFNRVSSLAPLFVCLHSWFVGKERMSLSQFVR